MQLQRMVADLKKSTLRDRIKHEELHNATGSSREGLKAAETKLSNLQVRSTDWRGVTESVDYAVHRRTNRKA